MHLSGKIGTLNQNQACFVYYLKIIYRVNIRSLKKHQTLSLTVVECNQLKWVGEFYVLISTT